MGGEEEQLTQSKQGVGAVRGRVSVNPAVLGSVTSYYYLLLEVTGLSPVSEGLMQQSWLSGFFRGVSFRAYTNNLLSARALESRPVSVTTAGSQQD